MRRKATPAPRVPLVLLWGWAGLVLLLASAPGRAAAQQQGASYLGCFSFPRLYYLKGVEGVKAAQHSQATIHSCFKDCRNRGYSLSIVATDYRCWCAISTPPPLAAVDESACQPGSSKGALVFYLYEGDEACRVQELDAKADSYTLAQPGTSPSSAVFDSLSQNMAVHADRAGVQRVVAKFPPQLYGQLEVTAKVSVHPAVITSIDVQEAGTSSPQVLTTSSEDISWQFYNVSEFGIGKNMRLGTASRAKSAASELDTLLKPAQYKLPGGLKQDENIGTAWVTYTINWQKDRVTWAMNGTPLLTKWATQQQQGQAQAKAQTEGVVQKPLSARKADSRRGLLSDGGSTSQQELQQKRQQQRKHAKAAAQQQQQQGAAGQQQGRSWSPPNKPAQLSFGVWWNPSPTLGSGFNVVAASVDAQQQPLQAPTRSSFMEVRRIVCDKPRVRGDKGAVVPAWFVLGPAWTQPQQAKQQQPQQAKQPQPQQAKQQTGKQQAGKPQAKVQAKPSKAAQSDQWQQRQEQTHRRHQDGAALAQQPPINRHAVTSPTAGSGVAVRPDTAPQQQPQRQQHAPLADAEEVEPQDWHAAEDFLEYEADSQQDEQLLELAQELEMQLHQAQDQAQSDGADADTDDGSRLALLMMASRDGVVDLRQPRRAAAASATAGSSGKWRYTYP